MKSNLPKVSIGITAYNEESNIRPLLTSLFAQKEKGFVLHEVILVSDGSHDKTIPEARTIKDSRLLFMIYKSRMGKTQRLNEIIKQSSGDVLILLDADILIPDTNVIARIIKANKHLTHGLVGINCQPLQGASFFERSINYSIAIQQYIRKHWNHGRNYLSFKGCFLVLTNSFAQNLVLPTTTVNNDAYFYFSAVERNALPAYFSDIFVYYKSPKTFKDHLTQSSRFQMSKNELEKTFKKDLAPEYRIPRVLLIKASFLYFVKNPLYFISYLSIYFLTKIKRQQKTVLWDQALSTKQIAYE